MGTLSRILPGVHSDIPGPGTRTPQVVDECDTAMSDHAEELDDNNEAVHSQEQELKRSWIAPKLSELPKLKHHQQHYPHQVDKQQEGKGRVPQAFQRFLDVFVLRELK